MRRQTQDGANQNIEIDDPFNGLSLETIKAEVKRVYDNLQELHSVVDLELLVKGAQLAKDFNARRDETMQLSEIEIRILEEEYRLKERSLSPLRHQMEGMRVTIMTTACAAAALGTWISDPLQGYTFGTKASVAPIFAAEAAMEKSRGRILMLWQLFDAMGIALGFIVALIFRGSWEAQLGAPLIPSLALMILVMLCPESPRLLIRNKRYAEAYKSLRRLRRLEIQAARDFYFIHAQLQQEVKLWYSPTPEVTSNFLYQEYVEQQNSFKRMLHLFTLPRNRRACIVAFLVMTAQQLCGINVLAYYSSNVFGNAVDDSQVNWLSFGFGTSNLIFTFPAFFIIDSQGRQFLLLLSSFGMTLSLLLASFCFEINPEGWRVAAVVGTVIVLFTGFYSIGAGPVPFTLSAEIFPLAFREVGMSFSVMVNFLGLGLLVLFVPRITHSWSEDERIGQRNVLFLFTGLNFATLILVPRTERRTLEGMNDLFNQPTMTRINENFHTAAVRLGLERAEDSDGSSRGDHEMSSMETDQEQNEDTQQGPEEDQLPH
ncbi:uncharacterized protein BJX67DRAFT_386803 [Aspergillus lucknowensis]|uniref:Major facilitator superfamily (MFS) profile domain-containing protein n=1 Tax=Aspergillus lucknowensis TaxID=176173 RepID=A0ABR4M764_9EURO